MLAQLREEQHQLVVALIDVRFYSIENGKINPLVFSNPWTNQKYDTGNYCCKYHQCAQHFRGYYTRSSPEPLFPVSHG